MTVYVIGPDGELVEKPRRKHPAFSFPTPRISRFEAMESPVTGRDITSWRERDKDMDAAGAVDARDLPRKPFEERKKRNERAAEAVLTWTSDPIGQKSVE